MNNNGVIYKITNNLYNEVYYGSTIRKLKDRINEHKRHFNLFVKNNIGWCQSYQIIMDDNYKVEKIEDYPCNSIRELEKREDYYILNFDNINDKRAHNTLEEKKAKKAVAAHNRHIKNRDEKNDIYKNQLLRNGLRNSKKIKCTKCNKIIRYDGIYKHSKTKYCLTYNTQN